MKDINTSGLYMWYMYIQVFSVWEYFLSKPLLKVSDTKSVTEMKVTQDRHPVPPVLKEKKRGGVRQT